MLKTSTVKITTYSVLILAATLMLWLTIRSGEPESGSPLHGRDNGRRSDHTGPATIRLQDEASGTVRNLGAADLVALWHSTIKERRFAQQKVLERRLRESGAVLLPELEPLLLQSNRFNEKSALIRLIGAIGHDPAVDLLDRYLDQLEETAPDNKSILVNASLHTLATLGTQNAWSRIVARLQETGNLKTRLSAIRALGLASGSQTNAITALITIVQSSQIEQERLFAVVSLGQNGGPRARAILEAIAEDDENPKLQLNAERTLNNQ